MAHIHNLEKFFSSDCKFIMGAQKIDQVKDSFLPEVAFIGRSNVGKSSLINTLLGQKIAITSKTPGRTRQLNFFILDDKLHIVDMPGYGYAKAGKKEVSSWDKLSYKYFASRANLKRVFLLIDSRRGIGDKDIDMINIFDALAVSYQVVLTKVDQLKEPELESVTAKTMEQSKSFPAMHPVILKTSSDRKVGLKELKKAIIEIM